jgi:hypothetical protein
MRFFTLVGIALVAASMQLKARAETLGAQQPQQLQAVSLAQLEAFAADDAEAAFQPATPEVRQQIGEAARFPALVRGNYSMPERTHDRSAS